MAMMKMKNGVKLMFGKAEEKGEPKLKGKALAREEKGEKAHKAPRKKAKK